MRGNTTQKIDRRLVETCRLFYEQRLSKSEIARRQRLSVTHVNRLLVEGQRLGFVEIRVVGPRLKSLELELLSKYALKDVRVISSSDDPSATLVEIGKQGARLFEEIVSPGSRVGVSSGRTMFELVSRVSEEPREITIYPLNIIHESETRVTGVSANTSATILWFRSRPSAAAHHVEMFVPNSISVQPQEFICEMQEDPSIREVRQAVANLDVYLLGAGKAGLESRFSELTGQLGATSEAQVISVIVGDVSFNALNKDGQSVTTGIDNLLFHVGLEQLQRAASSPDKSVVLVAGGEDKAKVIEAGLKARLCNILVTDSDVAEQLLVEKR